MPPVFWIQRQDIGPSARHDHGMAYDAGRDRVVLFGGDPGGQPLADTWEWDGSLWTQVADTGPSARRGTAMAFSVAAARIVLFGGGSGAGRLADTWTFEGTDWIQVADTGPSPRSDHAIAYDQARARLVLFGGQAGPLLGDTWEWDGSAWVQVQDVGPVARYGHVLGYDGALERVVLFGGADATGAGLGDTWTWDGSNWTQATDTGPAVRVGAAVAGGGSVLLFGGVNSLDPALPSANRIVYGDTWRWESGAWVEVQDIGPAPRWGHTMALGSAAGRTVLFGGSTHLPVGPADLRSDTWEVLDQAGTPLPGDGQPAGGVYVTSVQLFPQVLGPLPSPIAVTAQLSAPAVPGSPLTVAICTLVNGLPGVLVPAGYLIPSITFGGGGTAAQFTMVPDGTAMAYGEYVVTVAVGSGPMQGAAFVFA